MKKLIFCTLVSIAINGVARAADDQDVTNLFNGKTHLKNPLDLRDPFKRKLTKRKSSVQLKIKDKIEGIYTDTNGSIEGKPLESIRIIGIVIGAERRALAKVEGDENMYYIKEGMKLGVNGAEVKAILPGGIVLVEKIRNIYDQDEYLETVIPVSLD